MSEIENSNSIVPVPNEGEQQTPSNTNIENTKPVQNEVKIQYVKKEIEKFELKTAGFWVRFCAYVIDALVIGAIVGILVKPLFYLMDISFDKSVWYAPMAIISAIIYYAYFILTTKFFQQTLGKMIFGLKVVSENSEKLTWLTIIFRELVGRFISDTIKILYLMAAFMPKNQNLHDLFADTYVVHEKIYVKNKETIVEEHKIMDEFDSNNTATQSI